MGQQQDALKLANETREAAARVRRALASGEIRIDEAVALEDAGSLTLYQLLTAARWWGRRRAMKVIKRVELSESRRIRDLSPREKLLVISEVQR